MTIRAGTGATVARWSENGFASVAPTQQENASAVASNARVTGYDFGAAMASAQGGGNVVSVGTESDDLELDNSQINTGGVEVQASFAGTNAVGNAATFYVSRPGSG